MIDDIAGIEVPFDGSAPTLILFYHPHCPCTSATVRSLARLSNQSSVSAKIVAIAYCPGDKSDSWTESSLTETLLAIPNSSVFVDRDGEECDRFGAKTSGHILLYDTHGQLIFSGGITSGRGHEGDCAASTDLLKKINTQSGELGHWPVYGCPLIPSGTVQP